jgi:tRNA nucleotidyltransferase (CCA-adding enzyme)
MTADHFGRPPKPKVLHPAISELRAKAEELRLREAAPKPILLGRHLIARGLQPGVQFGALLTEAFEAQLEGKFTDLDGAWKWLDDRLNSQAR